eukprot:g3346.t1
MNNQKFFVGGNWKVNGTKESITKLISEWNKGVIPKSVEVVLAPTALHIHLVKTLLKVPISLSAQNISSDSGYGPYTGELTAELFQDMGCEWTLAGHSERRRRRSVHKLGHDEASDSVAKKTRHALNCGLKVIVCIGETLADRKAGATMGVLYLQLDAIRKAIRTEDWANIVLAYEPVWAIGTGVTATPAQAQEVHSNLREWLTVHVSAEVSQEIRIIYGGSVKPGNCKQLIAQDDIDGFLVGGASLKPSFFDIVNSCPAQWDSSKREKKKQKRVDSVNSIGICGK